MHVTLIRHGQTAGNMLNRYIGSTNEPLCELGEATAREKNYAAPARVYVSPMIRTVQTAKLLFPDAELIEVDGLREMDFGDFENRSAKDMEADFDYCQWVAGNCLSPCPNGESMGSFARRVIAAFKKLVREARARGEDDITIVTHGGCIMTLMSAYAKPRKHFYEWWTENCCSRELTLR